MSPGDDRHAIKDSYICQEQKWTDLETVASSKRGDERNRANSIRDATVPFGYAVLSSI